MRDMQITIKVAYRAWPEVLCIHYVLILDPKFCRLNFVLHLYTEPFTGYKIVENRKQNQECTELTQNNLDVNSVDGLRAKTILISISCDIQCQCPVMKMDLAVSSCVPLMAAPSMERFALSLHHRVPDQNAWCWTDGGQCSYGTVAIRTSNVPKEKQLTQSDLKTMLPDVDNLVCFLSSFTYMHKCLSSFT